MNALTVSIYVHLIIDGNLLELDEATVAAQIASGDAAVLRESETIDGRIRIGDAEIPDQLVSLVQRLCFDAVVTLLTDGTVFDYPYFTSAENAQLRVAADTIVLSSSDSDLTETTFPRDELLRGLYACGQRWITTLERLGRTWEVDQLQPYAGAAQAALASELTVDICVDLIVDGKIEELDEAAVAARIAAGDTATLHASEGLDGRLRIGEVEISDELTSSVQRLCFGAVIELIRDGAVVDYPYFSAAANLQLRADGDSVVLSASDVLDLPEATFPRRELLRGLYACGERWITTADALGRYWDVNQLRPYAAAAQAALAAAGLA
jgi:hypothetical protein